MIAMGCVNISPARWPALPLPPLYGERMAREALAILEDPARAAEMRAQLSRVGATLGAEGVIDRAAQRLLSLAGAATAPCGAGAGGAW